MAVSLSTFGSATQQPISNEPAPTPAPAEPTIPATPAVDIPSPATPVVDPTPINEPAPAAAPAVPDTAGGEPVDTFDFNIDVPGAATATPVEGAPAAAVEPTFDLDAILGRTDKKELLKKAGVSDFVIELNEHIARGGNPADYINAKSVNWDEVPDEDVIKSKLKAQYPSLTPDEVQRLYDRKYNNGLTEDDQADDAIQLKAEAYEERLRRKQVQAQFKLPDPIVTASNDPNYERWREQAAEQETLLKDTITYYNNHPATKNLVESKRVTIDLGEGIRPLNFQVSKPELITRALTDDGTIMRQLTVTETGEPDVQKEQMMALFAFNPQAFIQQIFNYGMQQGVRKKLVEEGQNAVRPGQVVTNMPTDQKPVYGTGKFGDKART